MDLLAHYKNLGFAKSNQTLRFFSSSFPLALLLFLVDHVTELSVVQLVVTRLVKLAECHLHLIEGVGGGMGGY